MSDETVNPSDPLNENAARAFEQSLAQLRPADCGTGRDNLMFAAGGLAAKKKLRAWQGVSGFLATGWMVTVLVWPAMLGMFGRGPDSGRNAPERENISPVARGGLSGRANEMIVAAEMPMNFRARSAERRGVQNYFDLRQTVLAAGVDAIPSPRASGGRPAGGGDDASLRTLQNLLAMPKGNAL